jgi:exopolysaccharide biosynthesis protein
LVREYGVWNALNLDGGGSTTMALEDPATHRASVVNASSDNPAGRSVGSSLAVFARTVPNP